MPQLAMGFWGLANKKALTWIIVVTFERRLVTKLMSISFDKFNIDFTINIWCILSSHRIWQKQYICKKKKKVTICEPLLCISCPPVASSNAWLWTVYYNDLSRCIEYFKNWHLWYDDVVNILVLAKINIDITGTLKISMHWQTLDRKPQAFQIRNNCIEGWSKILAVTQIKSLQ